MGRLLVLLAAAASDGDAAAITEDLTTITGVVSLDHLPRHIGVDGESNGPACFVRKSTYEGERRETIFVS